MGIWVAYARLSLEGGKLQGSHPIVIASNQTEGTCPSPVKIQQSHCLWQCPGSFKNNLAGQDPSDSKSNLVEC